MAFNKAAFLKWSAGESLSAACLRSLAPWALAGYEWKSKTACTEYIFGTSGRGSPVAAGYFRSWASLGIIEVKKVGRVTYYRPYPEIGELLEPGSELRARYPSIARMPNEPAA